MEYKEQLRSHRNMTKLINYFVYGLFLVALGCGDVSPNRVELLNVSYDPTRELWRELNDQFTAQWQAQNHLKIAIKQSHGGSATQARAIIDGLEADVATLAMYQDTNAIAKQGLLSE